jgi:hypothetical protein
MSNLVELDVSRAQVTGKGLLHLQQLRSLRQLDISITAVTDEDVDRLQAALPDCKIARSEK